MTPLFLMNKSILKTSIWGETRLVTSKEHLSICSISCTCLHEIERIEKCSFASLTKLNTLRISAKRLTILDVFSFTNLTKLQNLMLIGSKITRLLPKTFAGLHDWQNNNEVIPENICWHAESCHFIFH